MQHLIIPGAWTLGHTDPWSTQPPGGVAPSRSDMALARYLEAQAVNRGAGWSLLDACRSGMRWIWSRRPKLRTTALAQFHGLQSLRPHR